MRTDDIQPFTEYRAHLAEHHRRIQETGRPLFVTRDGRTSAVVLSPTAYDELAERAMLAEDVAAIRKAIEDSKAGKGQDAKQALREIADMLGLTLNR